MENQVFTVWRLLFKFTASSRTHRGINKEKWIDQNKYWGEYDSWISIKPTLDESADDKLMTFFLPFPENEIWHSMQIVSIGNVKFCFLKRKYFKMSSAENFTQHAKH